MMTRSLVNDDDVSIRHGTDGSRTLTHWVWASWRVTLALAVTLAPTLAPL